MLFFLIFFSLSTSTYGSTFMGKWKRYNLLGSLTDKAFMSLSLFFYHYENQTKNNKKNNEIYSIPINSTHQNITNIFDQDNNLGVLGNIRLDNSTYTNFGENHILCIGVYRKNASDIILVCPLRNLLLNSTKFNISDINNNSINSKFNYFMPKVSSLFNKIENLFRDFNYNETVNSITQEEFENFKSNIKNNNFRSINIAANRSFVRSTNITDQSSINSSKIEFDRSGRIYQSLEKQVVINQLQRYKMQIYNLSEFRSHFVFNISSNSSLQNNYFIINRHIYFSLIYFQVSNNGKIENPFDLNCLLNGLFFPETKNRGLSSIFILKAQELNASLFNREARTFGAISGVFFAFLILFYKITKFQDYHLISTITALMNTSYDLGYGNFLYMVGKLDESTALLFSILSLGYGTIFFVNTFMIVFKSWSSVNEARLRDAPPLIQRRYYTTFLFQCNAFYITSLLSFANISNNSIFIMTLLFSSWVPQIIFNTIKGCRNSIPKTYYVGITYIRLFEMGYNLLCPTSMLFLKKQSKSAFVVAFCWSSLQVAFLLLQGKFGGAFFLPKSMQNEPYDYYARQPPPHTECPICLSEIDTVNEVAVITPCNHAFHEVCIRRWMQEQAICPMCRRPLPPISEPEPIV